MGHQLLRAMFHFPLSQELDQNNSSMIGWLHMPGLDHDPGIGPARANLLHRHGSKETKIKLVFPRGLARARRNLASSTITAVTKGAFATLARRPGCARGLQVAMFVVDGPQASLASQSKNRPLRLAL